MADLSLVDETTLESLRRLSLLTPNSEVHKLSWRLGTDDEFCRLCPLTALVDLQNGAASHISNAKTPAQTLAVFEQLDIALQEATIVPGANVVSASRVVIGDNA
jgi:hypothetical protein